MPLEAGTFISDLNASNPAGTDTLDRADDHLRLIKSTVKATFPNITGAVTPTQADLNKLTSAGNPQFATIELGAASDTTLSRVSAGVIAVEGVAVPLNSITNTHTAQQIELGHASDTTITRSAAGVLAVEGGVIPKENRVNTFTVDQLISTGASQALLSLQANAAVAKTIQFLTGATSRWVLSSEATAESGSNAGSNFIINSYNDAGAYLGTPFQITRSTGNVGIGVTPSVKFDTVGPAWVRGAAAAGAVAVITPDATSGANGIAIEASFLTGGNGPIKFKTAATDRLQIDNLGNVLNVSSGGLGYGTGSGGTVTQITSKSTNVTLNKTNGQITMNNAALAASTSVNFGLVNSTIAATDTIIVNIQGGVASVLTYLVSVGSVSAGSAQICLRNISGGSLSEAVVLNFAVIKAVTS
jgi:hypothetical protein